MVERPWRRNGPASMNQAPFAATPISEEAFAKIGELTPHTDAQRSLKSRAIQVSTDLAQTRLALFVGQAGSSIPIPFLAVLTFWPAITFASFSLFARLSPTVIVGLVVFALSASAALLLILEMSEPFAGLMQVPSAPLRNALAQL